jgi:pimeloyl-ACP methyl ester carboxylesterase
MNYYDHRSEYIKIALTKYPAKIQPAMKTLIVNPGGPGLSGVAMVHKSGKHFSSLFEDRVDIIGFDPRGIGESKPNVKCSASNHDKSYLDQLMIFGSVFLPQSFTSSQAKYYDSITKLHSEFCQEYSGKIIGFMSTANIARDMEWIRVAVGMPKMNFMGISYGTVLGSTYANMYPQNVGHMILDGVVNLEKYFDDSLRFSNINPAFCLEESVIQLKSWKRLLMNVTFLLLVVFIRK